MGWNSYRQTNERLKQKLFWNTPYPWVYIQIWKLTLTSRLAEFLNNPFTCFKRFQNINCISAYPSVWVKHLPTNHYVLLIKHHNKSQGFHGCTLQAVISTQQTQYRNTGTPPKKPTKNWISPTGKGNSLNPPKKNITSIVSPLLGMYFEISSSQWETHRDVTSEKKGPWHPVTQRSAKCDVGWPVPSPPDDSGTMKSLGLSSKRILPIPGQATTVAMANPVFDSFLMLIFIPNVSPPKLLQTNP